jgi:hypothetical protein
MRSITETDNVDTSAGQRGRQGTEMPSTTSSGLPAVVVLATLLLDIVLFIRRYVVVTDDQAVAIALWIAHTHAILAAECTPYMQVTSATKRAGKTRLLEVLEPLVRSPWFTGRTSAAALIRNVDAKQRPTLLLDESDAAFHGAKEYAEALRGILNSGYRRSGRATVCTAQGGNFAVQEFSTFCPKAIAGIGELPGTIADRAIRIELRRRTTDEACERWRERDGHDEARPLYDALHDWANGAVPALRAARPDLPTGLGDRQADVWEPLFAIADMAGEEWPTKALKLAGSVEDTDITVELLNDIQVILADIPAIPDTVVATKDLLAKLTALEDRPWVSWRYEKPMTAKALAGLLAPLGVHPVHQEHVRGYRQDAFGDAFARYLPIKASLRQQSNKVGPEPPNSIRQPLVASDASKGARQPHFHWRNDGMTLEKQDVRPDGDLHETSHQDADESEWEQAW